MELPFRYTDLRGTENTVLTNDGTVLRTVIRGVSFSGADFDQLEPDPQSQDPKLLARFTLNHDTLCSCIMEGMLPISLVTSERETRARLEFRLDLGDPASNGGIDHETLRLSIEIEEARYTTSGRSGYFDDELSELVGLLPRGVRLKCCWTCAYSDYFPAGYGLFGDLACFRDNKARYSHVDGKAQLFAIWDTMTELVQETYLCPEHDWRAPGTGYRG